MVEELGIGRPSTYATIIEVLKTRRYALTQRFGRFGVTTVYARGCFVCRLPSRTQHHTTPTPKTHPSPPKTHKNNTPRYSYFAMKGTAMVPTLLGFVVVQLLERHFPDFVDAGFTSRMEAALDEIAQGKVDRAAYLDDYYRGLTSAIDLVSDAIDRKSAKRVLLRWVRGVGDGFWS